VSKSILKIHSRKTFCVERFLAQFFVQSPKKVTWDLRLLLGAILLAEKLRSVLTK
jgi:hypothetical protein